MLAARKLARHGEWIPWCDKAGLSLPDVARQAVLDGMFDEGHLSAFSGVTLDVQQLSNWLTTEQAQAQNSPWPIEIQGRQSLVKRLSLPLGVAHLRQRPDFPFR